MHDVTKVHVGTRSFQSSSRPMDYNEIEYKKSNDVFSDFTLQVPLVECWYSIKEEYLQLKDIKILLFQLLIYVGLDFLHTPQTKQHIALEQRQRHI